jgi:hypothetical protein
MASMSSCNVLPRGEQSTSERSAPAGILRALEKR